MFALLAVGMFAGLLFYLDQYEKGNVKPDQGLDIKELFAGNNDPQKNAGEAKTDSGHKKPSFEFYSLLRDLEVIVPESDIPSEADTKNESHNTSQPPPKNTPQNKAQYDRADLPDTKTKILPNTATRFFVQAGSFKDFSTADRMKANLALLGIVAKIESVKIPKSGTWHRVRVGPFQNKQQIGKVRRILKSNHIDSITVKIKS